MNVLGEPVLSVEADAGANEYSPKGKVAFVVPSLKAGGSERIVSGLANLWAERGGDVSIITFETPGTAPYYELEPQVRLHQLGIAAASSRPWHKYLQTGWRIKGLRQAFRELRPDVIISFLTKTNVMAILGARGLNIPVVVSERNNPGIQRFNALWTWARQRSYPHAFGLVTMTHGALQYFPQHMRPRSWVIPNPVLLPNAWQARRGQHVVAAVGRLVEQKGFDLLLQAFAKIAPRFPDWSLVIWGEGPERSRLEKLRGELGLAARVRMPGVTERPGLWVEEADLFVLSSRYEGWGIVLLEAMAAGLPVVSFDCEWGPREMITDGNDGLLVPVHDIDGLADALARLMADAAMRETMGTKAANSAARFAPHRISGMWKDVVDLALQAGRAD